MQTAFMMHAIPCTYTEQRKLNYLRKAPKPNVHDDDDRVMQVRRSISVAGLLQHAWKGRIIGGWEMHRIFLVFYSIARRMT